jgi:dihydroneopterin aldolase
MCRIFGARVPGVLFLVPLAICAITIFMNLENTVCVYIKDIEVKVRIGLYAWERKPQRIRVSVELYTDAAAYLADPQNKFIDYDIIHERVLTWPGRAHIDLIESFAAELIDLCFTFENVIAARVNISKPDIFDGTATPGIEIFMKRPGR